MEEVDASEVDALDEEDASDVELSEVDASEVDTLVVGPTDEVLAPPLPPAPPVPPAPDDVAEVSSPQPATIEAHATRERVSQRITFTITEDRTEDRAFCASGARRTTTAHPALGACPSGAAAMALESRPRARGQTDGPAVAKRFGVSTRTHDVPGTMATPTVMTLSSSVFEHERPIPVRYTCEGLDVSPPLAWTAVPASSKSLALVVDDPDGARGGGRAWVHWVVYNVPPTARALAEGSRLPAHAEVGVNDWGRAGYGGPCPPSGTHRYRFRLYALDVMIPRGRRLERQELEVAMRGHILAEALLIGTYRKTNGAGAGKARER